MGIRERGTEKRRFRGVTLIELLVVIAIISVLASAALPLSRVTVQRAKEMELRSSLRLLRKAIDEFKADCESKKLSTVEGYCTSDRNNYPESLELLTQPLKLSGAADRTRKYLRRIPRDGMSPLDSPDNPNNWGLRAYNDPPDSTSWGGDNVFDVYSKSDKVALDGSQFNTW